MARHDVESNSVTYGAAFADVYDAWYGDSDDLDSVVNLLCESRPQRVLELGVGTGRIALALAEQLSATEPLNANVVRIHGIDESPEMLALLRTKDVRQRITCHLGDMAHDQPPGPFDLVFLSYNTLFNLASPALQAECIANAAMRLATPGRLVIDACIIDPLAPSAGTTVDRRGPWILQTTSTFDPTSGDVSGDTVSTHDDGRIVHRPFHITYQSPEAIDAACKRAGLRLFARHSSWQKAPFDDSSSRHVSVYGNVR